MKRSAFTLVEIIFVVVISATLAMGGFKAMQELYIRSAKAKAITDMTLRSQIVLDQLGLMLYNRIPNSVIGYTPNGDCEAITELSESRPILEWLGTMDDELLDRKYDSFVDMGDSNNSSKVLSTPSIDSDLNSSDINLVFAGAFDEGAEDSLSACEGAFGWHSNDSNLSYDVDIGDNNITLTDDDAHQPEYIYEKYYLTNMAYAIARGKDLNETKVENDCSYDVSILKNFDNTLFLFYDYKPFKGETFCADDNGTNAGKVSVLSQDVSGFEAIYENDTIRLNLDMNRTIKGSSFVHISKQKAIF